MPTTKSFRIVKTGSGLVKKYSCYGWVNVSGVVGKVYVSGSGKTQLQALATAFRVISNKIGKAGVGVPLAK